MTDENRSGLTGYQGGQGARTSLRRVFAALQEKCRLRAALAAIQADIDSCLPTLSAGELVELSGLLAGEVAAADADAEALRVKVEQEAELARTQRQQAMRVTLPRRASAMLGAEAERRIARGSYPSAEALVSEAIERVYRP